MHACTRIQEEINSSGPITEELQTLHNTLREYEEGGEDV